MKQATQTNATGHELFKGGAKLSEHRLSNGMRVLLAERHSDPVVAVMLWYKVGARNESEREAGVSHFLEHMMFKGSQRFGKGSVDRMTTERGGSNNAFTSYDHTAYWFEMASDRWEETLEIEADRMRNLLLDAAEFSSEREVVLEELSMGQDDPWRQLADRVQAAAFPRHPYRRPIIGFTDTLRGMTVDSMRDYYRRFYHPGNATLVIAGDIAPERALQLAQEKLGSLPLGPSYAEADTFRPPAEEADAHAGELRLGMHWDDQGKRLCMAYPAAAVGTSEHWTLEVICEILGGGRNSRLYRELVLERGLATSVSVHCDTRIDGGLVWIIAECAQEADPQELERRIDMQLEALASRAVTKQELERVRRKLEASEAHESETATDLAEDLGAWAVDADWHLALTNLRELLAVDAARIRACAAKVFARDRRVVGWCLPKVQEGAKRPQRRARSSKPRVSRSRGKRRIR